MSNKTSGTTAVLPSVPHYVAPDPQKAWKQMGELVDAVVGTTKTPLPSQTGCGTVAPKIGHGQNQNAK